MQGLLNLAYLGLVASAAPEIEVAPISLFGSSRRLATIGCNNCCNTGECSRAYESNVQGVCCAGGGAPSCCPVSFEGQYYQCVPIGHGEFGCAPLPRPPAPAPPPPQQYQPPSAPAYQPPAPAPAYSPPAPAPVQKRDTEVCLRQTGGSCRFFGCSSSRGPTDCVGGFIGGKSCVCQAGYCAYNGKCIRSEGCDTKTPGTCSILSCSSKRGSVDCKGGSCVCKPGACAVDGVCTQKCPKATGGTCKVMGCSSKRNANCESGACVCGQNDCAWNGACLASQDAAAMWTMLATNMTMKRSVGSNVPEEYLGSFTDMMASYMDPLPDLDDPIFLGLTASLLAGISVAVGVSRRRAVVLATEPMLGVDA